MYQLKSPLHPVKCYNTYENTGLYLFLIIHSQKRLLTSQKLRSYIRKETIDMILSLSLTTTLLTF